MELKTLIFEEAGKVNTEPTLRIAHERALALGVRQVVVASSHGCTAREAQALFGPDGIQVIAVTICHGYEADGWTMTAQERADVTSLGVTAVTGIHALGDGVGTAFSDKYGGRSPEEIVRDTLYRFGQGMKVAVECVLMAADAGVLDMTREIISIAGTDEGADTAIVVRPSYPRQFHKFKILELLAKPRMS